MIKTENCTLINEKFIISIDVEYSHRRLRFAERKVLIEQSKNKEAIQFNDIQVAKIIAHLVKDINICIKTLEANTLDELKLLVEKDINILQTKCFVSTLQG